MRQQRVSNVKRNLLTVAIVALCLAVVACGSPEQKGAASTMVTDDYGRTVSVPARPQRVVSLSPAVTEIIYALGAEQLLVGRTDFCAYPPEAEQIASIGGISNLNVERIVAMKPDLVISGSMVAKKAVEQLDELGTPLVCVVEKPHFDALYDNIATIGTLVGREHEADSLNALLRERCRNLGTTSDTASRKATVYYVVGFGPTGNFTAGGNTFINDIISMAGGRNIAADTEGWSYSLEALMKQDPDYIIVRREDSAAFCAMQPYDKLSAVREGRVIGIVSGTLDLQVPRNIEAVQYLSRRMATNNIND